jgi:hypothetical protein
MKTLKFLNITSGPVDADELAAYDSRLRPVLAAHKAGLNLQDIY